MNTFVDGLSVPYFLILSIDTGAVQSIHRRGWLAFSFLLPSPFPWRGLWHVLREKFPIIKEKREGGKSTLKTLNRKEVKYNLIVTSLSSTMHALWSRPNLLPPAKYIFAHPDSLEHKHTPHNNSEQIHFGSFCLSYHRFNMVRISIYSWHVLVCSYSFSIWFTMKITVPSLLPSLFNEYQVVCCVLEGEKTRAERAGKIRGNFGFFSGKKEHTLVKNESDPTLDICLSVWSVIFCQEQYFCSYLFEKV